MKQLITVLIYLLSFDCALYAQFSVEVGKDTTFCTQLMNNDTYHLGNNVSVSGGEAPYQYSWECEYVVGDDMHFYASSFLNDTTLMNPYFTDPQFDDDIVSFILSVEDSNGNKAKDTINVRFSQFGYLLGNIHYSIHYGDSIKFSGGANISGGIGELSYYWTPSDYLADSTKLDTWCKPEKSINYSLIATDEAGCVSQPNVCYVIDVTTTGVTKNDEMKQIEQRGSILILPNDKNIPLDVSVFNIEGKLISTIKTCNNNLNLESILQKTGFYLCVIKGNRELIGKKMIYYNKR